MRSFKVSLWFSIKIEAWWFKVWNEEIKILQQKYYIIFKYSFFHVYMETLQ